jgi:hypothetical protein
MMTEHYANLQGIGNETEGPVFTEEIQPEEQDIPTPPINDIPTPLPTPIEEPVNEDFSTSSDNNDTSIENER